MIILDTPYHITFDGHDTRPDIACTGNCRKVWWQSDFDMKPKGLCPLCGCDGLSEAVEKVHYTILANAHRPLRLGDFTSVTRVPHSEKQSIKKALSGGAIITTLSLVKPSFIEKARAQWC